MGFEIDFGALFDRLEEIEKKASGQAIDNALEKGAEVILEAQKETVPVDTGHLEQSLAKGKIIGSGTNKKITIGIENGDDESIRYGYYQEYGTSNMVGKKWMKKAWNKSVSEANKAIGESLAEDLF